MKEKSKGERTVAELTGEELNRLLFLSERTAKIRLEASFLKKRAELCDLKADNTRHKINLLQAEASSLRSQALAKDKGAGEVKMQYDGYVKELAGKYNLPDHWAYDDNTGEVFVSPDDKT